VLDSKDEKDRELTAGMPLMNNHLCEECSIHFASVRSLLDALSIHYEVDGRLVRGLDYYTKTAFEITSTSLGSQDALAGGGRYDLLVEELGGKQTPGVGFAAGIERLLIVLAKLNTKRFDSHAPVLYFVGLDETARIWSFLKISELRRQGIRAEVDYLGRSVKSQMREANRQQALYVIVVGEQELKTKTAKLKNMRTGEETSVSLEKIEIPS
jgi:histidyl-tRNA synthetase